ILQRPDLQTHVITVEVIAVQLRQALAAVDVPAGDRLAHVVVVDPDRLQPLLARPAPLRAKRVDALAPRPAVVAARPEDVDLLPQVLAHVAGPQLARLAIERHPPEVAHAVAPDLRPGLGVLDERVVRRDRVVLAVVL